MGRFLGTPEIAAAHGASLDEATWYVHWLMLFLFVGWSIYFVYVLYRFRVSKSPKANYHGTKSHYSTYVEGAVVVAEAILLLGFSFPLWAAYRDVYPPVDDEALEVRLISEQFAWNAHYPGEDGKFGATSPDLVDSQSNSIGLDRSDPNAKDDIVTMNQLHLPVDRTVLLRLSSKDVIHSLSLNEMRVKQDAIPGMEIPVSFVPTVTTEEMREIKGNPDFDYEIACAQLCGIGHYRMRGFMTVHTQEDFQAWLDEQAGYLSDDDEEGDDFWG